LVGKVDECPQPSTVKWACMQVHTAFRPILFARKAVRMCALHTKGGERRWPLTEKAQLVLQQGDITQWRGDAIVNAGPNAQVLLGELPFKPS